MKNSIINEWILENVSVAMFLTRELFLVCSFPASSCGEAGKPSSLSHTVSPLPVNKPCDFLLFFSVQPQAQHNIFRPAYPAVPLASVLCINICLHQWPYCTDCEGGRECPQRCVRYCFSCSSERSGSAATLCFTSQLGSTHPALSLLPESHHAPLCPTSLLLLCHQLLFVFLIFRCLISPLPWSHILVFPLHMSAHCLTFFFFCPLSSLNIFLMRTLHRLKLMSSPSLSELGKSEKSSPEDRGEKQKRAGANATWNRYSWLQQRRIICMDSEQHWSAFYVHVAASTTPS